jgi:branched-chain amino acid transport system substrate-binding protein
MRTAQTAAVLGIAASFLAGIVTPSAAAPTDATGSIRIGAMYPLTGPQGGGGRDEYHGLQTAMRLVNARGGVHGHPISLDVRDTPNADSGPTTVDALKRAGYTIVMGSYGSTISVPASAQAQHDGVIFWESGAVATMVTQPGHPNVFRTVTTGNSLGRAAARYAAQIVAPRLGEKPPALKAVVLYVNDPYGSSVGPAMVQEAKAQGFQVKGVLPYDPYSVNMPRLVHRLAALHPDIVLVVGYVQDAVTFRRQMLKQGVHPAAMIGTSSAFCMQAFGNALGGLALGLFASDKPDADFSAQALLPVARTLRAAATKDYTQHYHTAMTAASVAGFVAGWVLFHEVLPHAASLTPAAVRKAALAVNLPYGSEINGAGVRFAPPSAPDGGQNLRAISVIWQWQSPRHEVVVYPPAYATAKPKWIPLHGWRRP